MSRDARLLQILRDATLHAARNLDNLKLIKPEQNPEVARLRRELAVFLVKHQTRVVKEARSALSQAKKASRRHRLELAEMKRAAKQASASVYERRKRHGLEKHELRKAATLTVLSDCLSEQLKRSENLGAYFLLRDRQ